MAPSLISERAFNRDEPEKASPPGFGTRAVHVGSAQDGQTGAIIPPISLATTYKHQAPGVHSGFAYSRIANPNRDALELMLASLESGGAHALAFASGSAATATVINTLGSRAHIVCAKDVYSGTFRYLRRVAEEAQGLDVTFLSLESISNVAFLAALQENTKLIWIESPSNPTLRLVDVAKITSLAHSHPSKPLVVVDNTFLSPFYSSPLLLGADIVVHSITKHISGHSDVIMGAVILPERHAALASRLRFLQRAVGAVPSPFDCWLAQRGAKTLHLRMKVQGTNALAIAQALEKSPHVEEVLYPGLASHPLNHLACQSLSAHARTFVDSLGRSTAGFPYGGIVSFRIRGGEAEADKFLTSTKFFVLAESLGGVESLAQHPETMTHVSLPEAERVAQGVGPNLIRLSVGVEDVDDLLADIQNALEVSMRS